MVIFSKQKVCGRERELPISFVCKGQKVGQTIREALTHLDPDKKAASRKRRAISKAKRCVQDSDDQWQGHDQMDYQPEDVKSLSKESTYSQTTEETAAAAMETHPLESILVAMAVQRDRDTTAVTSVVDDDLFSEDCLSSSTSAGSQLCKPNMMMVATNQSGVRNRVG